MAYYATKSRLPSARAVRDAGLVSAIRQVHKDNVGVYGARKVHAELNRRGIEVARCTVERLMRAEGLQGIRQDKTRKTTQTEGAETPRRPISSSGGSSPRLLTSCGWRT